MTGCLKIKKDAFYAVLNLKESGKYKAKVGFNEAKS